MLPKSEVSHTITEVIEYPVRANRTNTKLYNDNHKQLVHKDKVKCFMCEMLNIETPNGVDLETHHIFEHSEENNMCFTKVQKIFDMGVFDFHGYGLKLKGTPVYSVDDIRNLVVLCQHHHIEKGCSAHLSSFSMFCTQLVAKDGVEILKGVFPK